MTKKERKERIIENLRLNTKDVAINDFINEQIEIFSEVPFNDVCVYYEIDEEYNDEELRIILTIKGDVKVRITIVKEEDGNIYCIFNLAIDHTVLVADELPQIELKDKLLSIIEKISKVEKEDNSKE